MTSRNIKFEKISKRFRSQSAHTRTYKFSHYYFHLCIMGQYYKEQRKFLEARNVFIAFLVLIITLETFYTLNFTVAYSELLKNENNNKKMLKGENRNVFHVEMRSNYLARLLMSIVQLWQSKVS